MDFVLSTIWDRADCCIAGTAADTDSPAVVADSNRSIRRAWHRHRAVAVAVAAAVASSSVRLA